MKEIKDKIEKLSNILDNHAEWFTKNEWCCFEEKIDKIKELVNKQEEEEKQKERELSNREDTYLITDEELRRNSKYPPIEEGGMFQLYIDDIDCILNKYLKNYLDSTSELKWQYFRDLMSFQNAPLKKLIHIHLENKKYEETSKQNSNKNIINGILHKIQELNNLIEFSEMTYKREEREKKFRPETKEERFIKELEDQNQKAN